MEIVKQGLLDKELPLSPFPGLSKAIQEAFGPL